MWRMVIRHCVETDGRPSLQYMSVYPFTQKGRIELSNRPFRYLSTYLSDITNQHRFAQRIQFIGLGRDKFLSDIAFVTSSN